MSWGTDSRWMRHVVYRKESVRTTWKFRVGVALACVFLLPLTQGIWAPRLGNSLVCTEQIRHVDAILLENFDPNYPVFERAAELRRAGMGARALVPARADLADARSPNMISEGIIGVMARAARLQDFEIIPIANLDVEPIALNTAYQIGQYVAKRNIKSVVVVAPAFRSRRSFLVYDSVLQPSGVTVGCAPVFDSTTSKTWMNTWHGIQGVVEQFVKLQYYRFYVLPFLAKKENHTA